jgi:GntR family transcriptional regulator, vanillate catabolism transcriptional regulator
MERFGAVIAMADTPLLDKMREMILEGALQPGQRVTEAGLAEQLGISRTPIRTVLATLAAEGFLKPVGRRGFAVAAFSDTESIEALEIRAVLEGQAARTLARTGIAADVLAKLTACLADGDLLFRKGYLKVGDREKYGEMNARFHALIVEASESLLLNALIDRVNRVPFVRPSIIAFDHVDPQRVFGLLFQAHGQHHAIVEAIRERDGARADMLFREHAIGQRHSLFERRMHL